MNLDFPNESITTSPSQILRSSYASYKAWDFWHPEHLLPLPDHNKQVFSDSVLWVIFPEFYLIIYLKRKMHLWSVHLVVVKLDRFKFSWINKLWLYSLGKKKREDFSVIFFMGTNIWWDSYVRQDQSKQNKLGKARQWYNLDRISWQ